VGRIDRGGGEGGDPALSPPGWKSYASRVLRTQAAHDVGTCQGNRAVLIASGMPLEWPCYQIDPSYLRHAVTSRAEDGPGKKESSPMPGILPDGRDLRSEAQSQLTNDRLAFPPYDDISFLVRYPR
jgi:hypothetical protein